MNLGWLTDRAMHRTPQNRRCTALLYSIVVLRQYQLRNRPKYVADEIY